MPVHKDFPDSLSVRCEPGDGAWGTEQGALRPGAALGKRVPTADNNNNNQNNKIGEVGNTSSPPPSWLQFSQSVSPARSSGPKSAARFSPRLVPESTDGGVQGGSRSGGNFSPVISNFPSSPRGRGITKGQRIRPRKIKHPRKSRRGNAARRAASPTSACPRGEGSRGKLRTVSSAPGFGPIAFCIIPCHRSNLPPPGPVRPGLPGASPQLSRAASLSLRRFPPHTRC